MQQIKEKLVAVGRAYKGLAGANKSFSFAASGMDGFRNLIEQRNMIMEDLDVLSESLIREVVEAFPALEPQLKNLIETLLVLVDNPEFAGECETIKSCLSELVDSDAALEKEIESLRDDMKAEIGRIRQGARGLRGYRQIETFGSCFIDKIK